MSPYLEKLLWLPHTYKEVIVFFSGMKEFDMGQKKAQDLYGVALRVVLAIDNSEEANEVYQKTFPGVGASCLTRLH